MRIGLFGFPMTGKTTLFRLLTGSQAPARSGRGEAQVGVARVPDPRLDRLAALYRPRKVTPATVEYLDLAGVAKGEAAEALPLEQLRSVDALAHVVRAFHDDAIPHVEGSVDPARDVELMETELVLADHTIAERRVQKLEAVARKTRREEDRLELDLLRKCLKALEAGTPLRNMPFAPEEAKRLRGFTFLSQKPLLVVVNAGEEDTARLAGGAAAFGLESIAAQPQVHVVALSARIEQEIAQLEPDDAEAFRREMGIHEPALERMIRASYVLLDRISFFTVGEDEVRAWTVGKGTRARQAAGTIHTDMERGFIRAEVLASSALLEHGSWAACREKGLVRLEGKDYVVQDGDILHVRFNV